MSFFSPVNQARWARFRHNRRGYWSPWLLLTLFLCSPGAELLANDRPLLVQYRGQLYVSVLKNYTEQTFGGVLITAVDYQDPWLQHRLSTHGWALWPLVRFGATMINFANTVPFSSPPSASNRLGTDANGSDALAWILYGTCISVFFGLLLMLFSNVLGVLAGVIQGYYGGKIDLWGQRLVEVWSEMPTLFLIILLSSVVQSGFWWLLAITVLFGWTTLVDVMRAEFLRTRNYDYIRAVQTLGVSDRQITLRHMLPNVMVAIPTLLPFILRSSIITLTSLDFLGLGLPFDSPSLEELLPQGKNNLQAPRLGIAASLSVAVLLTLLTFIGEVIHDASDPSEMI